MTDTREVITATLSSKGQVTIPAEVRAALGIKAGDKLEFRRSETGEFSLAGRKRRSILDFASEHPLVAPDRPFRNEDIDEAVRQGLAAREERIRSQK